MLRIRIDDVCDLLRPERRIFDRVRECVVQTSATAPFSKGRARVQADYSASESSGGSDEEAVAGPPPAYLRGVVVEIQVGYSVWQTHPFDVTAGRLKPVGESFEIPLPRRGTTFVVRALKTHRLQRHALIGEATLQLSSRGAQRVSLARKSRERGKLRLHIDGPPVETQARGSAGGAAGAAAGPARPPQSVPSPAVSSEAASGRWPSNAGSRLSGRSGAGPGSIGSAAGSGGAASSASSAAGSANSSVVGSRRQPAGGNLASTAGRSSAFAGIPSMAKSLVQSLGVRFAADNPADAGPLSEDSSDAEGALLLAPGERGDMTAVASESDRLMVNSRSISDGRFITAIIEMVRSVPLPSRRTASMAAAGLLAVVFVFWLLHGLYAIVTARYLPSGALAADTPGMLQLGEGAPCLTLRVLGVEPDGGGFRIRFRTANAASAEGFGDDSRTLTIVNVRTGLPTVIRLVGESSCWIGSRVAVGDQLSTCTPKAFARQLSTEHGIDSSCMDYNHWPGRGANVAMVKCHHGKNQQWYWDADGERIKNAMDERMCLDYEYGSWITPKNVKMSLCSKSNAQKWYWDGNHLRSRRDDGCLTFDVMGTQAETTRGPHNNVFVHGCEGNRSQQWYFHSGTVPCESGVSKHSGTQRAGPQVARRCLPTYNDFQKVTLLHVEYALQRGPGNFHTGLRLRGDCELVNKPFVDFAAVAGSPAVMDVSGAGASDADSCYRLCVSSCCCSAWQWNAQQCSLFQRNLGVGAPLRGSVFGYLQSKDPLCIREVADIVVGGRDIFAEGAIFPHHIVPSRGEVRYNERAIETQMVVYRPCPTGWTWNHAVTNLGELTGQQANAFSDWVTVPNSRADTSPIANADENYLSKAPQYNYQGAVSRAPPYGRSVGRFPLEYLLPAKSEDFVMASLKWMSSQLGLVMTPVPDGAFCSGEGCGRTELGHSLFGIFVTGNQAPTLIGPHAGKECADWWKFLQKSNVELTDKTTVEALLKLMKGVAHSLVFDGMAKKACVYNKHRWWSTPLNLLSTDFLAWSGSSSPPWYHHTPYSCPALGGCSKTECSAHSFQNARVRHLKKAAKKHVKQDQKAEEVVTDKEEEEEEDDDESAGEAGAEDDDAEEVCISKDKYWAPEPIVEKQNVYNFRSAAVHLWHLAEREQHRLRATSTKSPTQDYTYELVLEKLMTHMRMTLRELLKLKPSLYPNGFRLTFNPLIGFLDDRNADLGQGPYAREAPSVDPSAGKNGLHRIQDALEPLQFDEERERLKQLLEPYERKAKESWEALDMDVSGPFKKDLRVAGFIDKLSRTMRMYRATPWGRLKPPDGGPMEYHPLDFRDFPIHPKVFEEDRPEGHLSFKNAHAGDLLQHSKWSAVQAAIWIKNKAEWTEGLDQRLVIMASYLHDLGKAGDCAFTCMTERYSSRIPRLVDIASHEDWGDGEFCYQDTYSPLKYQRQNDLLHPEYSAQYLGGDDSNQFWLRCPDEYEMKQMWHARDADSSEEFRHLEEYRDTEFFVTSKLERWKESWQREPNAKARSDFLTPTQIRQGLDLSPLDAYKITVAARMHWDLGRLNLNREDPKYLDPDGYLRQFAAVMSKFSECGGERPGPDCIEGVNGQPLFECKASPEETRNLLKLCLAVAAADIAGASPSRDDVAAGRPRSVEKATFVSASDNGALQFCEGIDKPDRKDVGLSPDAQKLIAEICASGCIMKEDDSCSLHQHYPALDPWTAYGFGEKGLSYRSRILNRFDELARDSARYGAFCATSMGDLADAVGIEYTAMRCAGAASGDEWIKLYVETLPATGAEQASCTSRYGFVEGLCSMNEEGQCDPNTDKRSAPCSPPGSVEAIRGIDRWNPPETARSYAYVYTNEDEAFHFGGFVFFDAENRVARVNYLSKEPRDANSAAELVFGQPQRAAAADYNALREVLHQGVRVTEPGFERYTRYAWVPPGTTEAMPCGGMALLVRP